MLFSEYQNAFSIIMHYLQERTPQSEGESHHAYENRIRSSCADVCRYFLPTSSLANVGLTINARALEHALSKMLSHPLHEVREIGEEIKKVAIKKVPTLVKYANPNDYLIRVTEEISSLNPLPPSENRPRNNWCSCVDYDRGGESKILTALLFRFTNLSYQSAFSYINNLHKKEIKELAAVLLGKLDCHDIPVREMEYADVTFDLIIDQGAYFELKRHRMMSQTVQAFSPNLGYAVPKVLYLAGLLDRFTAAMEKAKNTFNIIYEQNPHAAQYVLPNAYNRRVLLKMNLRTALHLIHLRCAPNAHFGIRLAALRLAEEIRKKFPLFAQYFEVDSKETWQSLKNNYFFKTF